MEVKELEELKIGLENQCLILVRQTEDSDVKLDEIKEEHESWKEKIKELLVKVDGEKINVVTLLGYYRGIASQIDIEKKKVFAIKKYFEDKSIELKEQIDIESSKLSKTKADNSGFVASLKRQQKLIDDAAKGLAIIQETFDKDTEEFKIKEKELVSFKKSLEKDEKKLDTISTGLMISKENLKGKDVQAKAKLKKIDLNNEQSEINLAHSVKLVENNKVKRQKLKQQQEAVVNDKRELKKREQWLLNDQKKMASDRSSLRSAIYEFKRSKK